MVTHYGARYAMGTRLEIVAWDLSEKAFQSLLSEITEEVNRIENVLSVYSRTSFIHNLNSRANEKPVLLNNEIWSLVQNCLRFNRKTKGAFDITLGLSHDLSKYDENSNERRDSSMSGATDTLILDSQRHSIQFSHPGMSLDFGAIGKGYTLDKVRSIVTSAGVNNALINFGRSIIYAKGNHPSGNPWNIGIQTPGFASKPINITATLDDLFLSTSASFRGKGTTAELHPHIIDPRSGAPVNEMRQVSITSSTGIEAEALSTALVVLSDTEGNWIIKEFPESQIVKIFNSNALPNLAGSSN